MPVVKADIRSCSGLDKAAMIMLSLAEEHASKLFAMMEDDEIKDVSQRMSTLGILSNEIVEKLFVEFVQKISSTGSLVGSYESVERLLNNTLGKERVDAIMEDIRGPAGRTMWDKLGNVNEMVLANYLKNEYPQTVAVVMSKVKSDHAARVLASLPDDLHWRLVHIGDGPLHETLERAVRAAGLDGRVDWLGAQPQDVVLRNYRAADLFVLASRIADDGDRDGLPNVLMEAQSQGLAVLATRVSAVPELIEDGVTGCLVEPRDRAALGTALAALIGDPARRARLGAAGEARVRERFAMRDGIVRLAAKFGLAG